MCGFNFSNLKELIMFAFEDDVVSTLFAEDVIKHVVHDVEVLSMLILIIRRLNVVVFKGEYGLYSSFLSLFLNRENSFFPTPVHYHSHIHTSLREFNFIFVEFVMYICLRR